MSVKGYRWRHHAEVAGYSNSLELKRLTENEMSNFSWLWHDGCVKQSSRHKAYLGLVPSEQSSGASVTRGGITKAGNSAPRRLLIEAAWTYRFPARLSCELLLRQESQPKPIH